MLESHKEEVNYLHDTFNTLNSYTFSSKGQANQQKVKPTNKNINVTNHKNYNHLLSQIYFNQI